jgi:hypothetical protein
MLAGVLEKLEVMTEGVAAHGDQIVEGVTHD